MSSKVYVKVHAFIISHLHEKMPGVFGNKRKEKEKLINNLEEIFEVNHFYFL